MSAFNEDNSSGKNPQKHPFKHSSRFKSYIPFSDVMFGVIRFQVFPLCVITSAVKRVGSRCVSDSGCGERLFFSLSPVTQTHVISTFCSQRLTRGRKCRLYIREKRKHNGRSVGKAGGKASGSRPGPIRASSPLKGRRTRGADCRLEPRQAHKANRRSWAPDAVMATVMQVARRDLNLDRKKESRGMDYYYRVPHEKYET